MLDTATRKRIDDCRDILVGKLPDPKAQIEQITIALIYKFMDDMDKEAIELGGKVKFFSDYKTPDPKFPNDRKKDKVVEFKKYSWNNLTSPQVSAAEMLKLYSEAIEGMSKNPNIPQLFRDIFNNAYLPYRSPETLKLFLKTIGEFEYTHSEKLGDAFEYLLSVMGSQGDAGQFRTPRHIIDFLVAVVNPGKNDTILDPACGTAGFLISAFKHIKESNKKGLTPDERKKLIKNFVGYDISPDMVRLSRVNLYLHGFSDPHIYEYDTLSSEDRWKESFDVVLANPPFMSPKGGIRPHKKFSISSNRSEVLFVDYIAEHLNPKGRAGIIVPEGVIFQSGTAYKDLRKMLVDNYLYAVVSLPAGVFNPYSGVKTSILLMDKELAKKGKEILFVKIDNDGYNLGAQRNAVKGGQLENAIETIAKFRTSIEENKKFKNTEITHAVSKAEIGKSGDYNLSGERYRDLEHFGKSSVEIVKLNEIAELIYGYTDTAKDEGDARFIRITDISEYGQLIPTAPKFIMLTKEARKYILKRDDVLVARTGATFGKTMIYESEDPAVFASFLIKINLDKTKILPKYYWAFSQSDTYWDQAKNLVTGGGQPQFNGNALKEIKVPIPSLAIQQQIVTEIEAYQKIIDGAKMVVENYKPKIEIDPEWEMVALGEVCEKITDGTHHTPTYFSSGVIFLSSRNVTSGKIDWDKIKYIDKTQHAQMQKRVSPKLDDVLLAKNGTTGVAAIVDRDVPFDIYVSLALLRASERILPEYLLYCLNSSNCKKQFDSRLKGVGVPNLHLKEIREVIIPLPALKKQNEIVNFLKKEQSLITANNELITIFEQKIKDVINKVWQGKRKEYKEKKEELRSDSYRMVAE